jgi:nucleotidyltransferase/DNA polymerase involved in DNA repair
MLLERIDIDSCGSLERVQLGPFSHRLNAVFGPPGSGKTATLEFVRSVMLGTDRHWHKSCVGRVVWADRDGLLHFRRESDGTPHGRLSVDYVDRNGYARQQLNGYRDVENYQRVGALIDLPKNVIDALVAPGQGTTWAAMIDACQQLGLVETYDASADMERKRLHSRLQSLKHQLSDFGDAYPALASLSRGELEARRRALTATLARVDHFDTRIESTSTVDSRRGRLEVRLSDARDEVARLRNQESDLRRSLAGVDREMSECGARATTTSTPIRIAAARRFQLEELDSHLMRLGRTLREIRSIRDNWSVNDAGLASPDATSMRYYATTVEHDSNSYYRSRLEAARRHLDALVRHHDSRYADYPETHPYGPEFQDLGDHPMFIGRSDLQAMAATIRSLIESLGRIDYKITAGQIHDDHLQQCESKLSESIRRLVDRRNDLLQRIASEHGLSVNHLTEAFGDWCQCHDQPHLYQWLLSDHFPPQVEDSVVLSARRGRLEAERNELLDELSRTVNRLQDSVREVRTLELRLRDLPVERLVVSDRHRTDAIREELKEVENRLGYLDARLRLEHEIQSLSRQLDGMPTTPRATSGLRDRAGYWLQQMTAGRLVHLLPEDSHFVSPRNASTAAADNPRSLQAASQTERSLVTLALRMAAADLMGQRGVQLPLLLDDPASGWFGALETAPLINAWSRFAEAGHQLIALTAHRGLVEGIRTAGGAVQTLVPSHYYQMRYRDTWQDRRQSLGQLNRELDTVWRENNGVFDDPYWYRPAADPAPTIRYRDHSESIDANRVSRGPASPFFLTSASPIDQAPSIDAVAAQRLNQIGIATVGQLLTADPHRLADRLELADVTPAVVNRWQSESTLVCGVPQLRNFDARVLVGCGFTTPEQLARMHPGRLLERVEAFLATDRGRQILRSGTSYELSRITSWIAAANRSVARSDRYPKQSYSASRNRESLRTEPRESFKKRRETDDADDRSRRRGASGRRRKSRNRHLAENVTREEARPTATVTKLKFYLHRESPIVDAPSIGPKTAAKLQALGIHTVDSFLTANPDRIASQLRNRRITRQRILAWQQQASLVCRIPMLRGHDAQLMVEAGITEPKQVAGYAPESLLAKIIPVARSAEGKRILRGATEPDLAEVTDWIEWAKEQRPLKAA